MTFSAVFVTCSCVALINIALVETNSRLNKRTNKLPYGHHIWLIMAPYNNSYLRNESSSCKKSNTLHLNITPPPPHSPCTSTCTPSTAHHTAFHNPLHTTNKQTHKAYLCKQRQNGTRCRDGVKVLSSHSSSLVDF